MASVNQSVGVVLDFLFLLTGNTLVVSDVQMCFLIGLLGTSLPDMRSKDVSAGSKDDMSSGMMGLELSASFSIDCTLDSLSNNFGAFGNLRLDLVEDAFADLQAVNNLVELTLDGQSSSIVLLTT